jgi:hypothetical protein
VGSPSDHAVAPEHRFDCLIANDFTSFLELPCPNPPPFIVEDLLTPILCGEEASKDDMMEAIWLLQQIDISML